MRYIHLFTVRRDTGEGYDTYLEGLAQAEGIEMPTRQDLAKHAPIT